MAAAGGPAFAPSLAVLADPGEWERDPWSGDVVDGVLSWTGALPRGASAVITYSVRVEPGRPADARLVNAVVSPTTGSSCTTAGVLWSAGISGIPGSFRGVSVLMLRIESHLARCVQPFLQASTPNSANAYARGF